MTVEHEEEQADTEVSQSNGISHATEEPKAVQPEKEKQVATKTEVSSVSDPDPNWTRIQSGQWIRIRNPDPDSIRSVDSYSESGSRRAKVTRKSRINSEISCFEVLDVPFIKLNASYVTWTSFCGGLPPRDR